MVQSKSDREKQQLITDKCQALIEMLLKDDDNKYCVDCDAKGPRWASWNLGIFLCIRCAGIHRNLGVHISRVKSVNLDAWTPEQVAYVQRMGNSRARAIYEANLPDDFRRPQIDTTLDSFIRAKYEHKKYIAHNYVDPGPPEPAFNAEEELKRMKEQKRSKLGGSNKTMISVSESFASSLSSTPASKPRTTSTSSSVASSTANQHQQQQQQLSPITTRQPQLMTDDNSSAFDVGAVKNNDKAIGSNKSALADLLDLDFGGSGNVSVLNQQPMQAFTMSAMHTTPAVAASNPGIDSIFNDPIMVSMQTNPIPTTNSQPQQPSQIIQPQPTQQQQPQSNNKFNLIDF